MLFLLEPVGCCGPWGWERGKGPRGMGVGSGDEVGRQRQY